jgi:hypothetical protein
VPSAGRLVGLHSLGLRSNCLTELPDEVGRLSGLTYLDASMNHIAVSLFGGGGGECVGDRGGCWGQGGAGEGCLVFWGVRGGGGGSKHD